MSVIQTVTGPLSAKDMGRVTSHDHIFCDDRCYSGDDWKKPENEWLRRPVCMEDLGRIWYNLHKYQDNVLLDDPALACEELSYFKEAGGGTIIDCTSIGILRRPAELKAVSEKTGIPIVMGTGAYLEAAQPDFIRKAAVAELTSLFIHELNVGADDTDIRCGFVGEIGISNFGESETRVLRAGARAAAETGTAVLIHQPGLDHENQHILDVIASEGCPLDRVVLSHNDVFWDQPDYLCAAMDRGAYICFDTFGLQMVLNWSIPFPRDWDRLTAVKELIRRGYGKQILFGQDTCFKVQYRKFGGWGYAHLFNEITPLALGMGYTQDELDDILIHNPARVFCGE